MEQIEPFASQKIKPYGTDVSDAVETNWTIRAAVSAFVVIALASFCSPSPQTLHSSTTGAQHRREQSTHKGKINFCVLAKTPAKLCIRKGGAQQPVQLFYSAGDVSLRRINFSARSLCATGIHSDIARGSLTLRERAPPV
ncbi:MAG: hypothetical protein DME55_14575 [Verrucomicrobia bacterium]|nr:MAG: hypothetical protein DME55_14575 [Verrucomicrobiota bacterium]